LPWSHRALQRPGVVCALRIVRFLVERIGGELRIGRGDKGPRFTVTILLIVFKKGAAMVVGGLVKK
jgi:hypothetical protein